MKIKNYVLTLFVLVLGFYSCNPDNETTVVAAAARDRTEQAETDLDSIEMYLSTHFFNYEEFEADPTSSTYKVVIDTIAGDNMDKTPMINQLDTYLFHKTIEDYEEVEYKLYYLKVREGLGDAPKFADSTRLTYRGNMINDDYIFDSQVNPTWLSLYTLVQGFRETMVEFRASDGFDVNGDGTYTYNNYGAGAMFIPSGLAYFANPPTNISLYSPLIFTFELINVNLSDNDNDGIPNYLEDIEEDSDLEVDRDGDGDSTNDYGDRNVYNDDTDGDLLANFIDPDDDGDGTLTKYEDLEPDSDLNVDRDGDGDPTNDYGDGDPTNDDSDGDGIPNYLDTDSTVSNQDL